LSENVTHLTTVDVTFSIALVW